MIREAIKKSIAEALNSLSLSAPEIILEHPADFSHGDYSTNVAMMLAKQVEQNPKQLAEKIIAALKKPDSVEKIEIAGPGFINFHLSQQFFANSVSEILQAEDKWGHNEVLADKKIMVEYTDPNPFKEFHIGHLMSNAIGESISRLIEASGAEVKRANYQGDVGPHVAKAIYGMLQLKTGPFDASQIGAAYALGARAYEEDEQAKKEIDEINIQVYKRSNDHINGLYDTGRSISLNAFEDIYKTLGTKFDHYFFESESGPIGQKLVKDNVKVFEESDGAVVFRGEEYGLHTRVFLTSEGLPTYEAKDLGLVQLKAEAYSFDTSITITASEQLEYFKVIKKAMEQIFPKIAEKIVHLTHGMMRLPSGKMSSRKGDVVTGESLISQITKLAAQKMREGDVTNKEQTAEQVAIGAIKYSILKQTAGKDIVFDFERSLSFEGDSGPYLQYTHARAHSVLEKASSITLSTDRTPPKVTEVERLIYQFPEVVSRACAEYEPHYVTTYLTSLAGAFNSWYGREKIIDDTVESAYKLALTKATAITLKNGLWLLGIETPEKM